MAYRPADREHQRLASATYLAALAHDGQFRKDERVPYLVHPLRVGEILAHAGAEDDVIIAGVLHDVLEDGCLDERGKPRVDEEEIRQELGASVLELVRAASEPDKEASWEERKQHTIDSLSAASLQVLQVVCADKLDNVSSAIEDERRLGSVFWYRFNRPREDQRWYYQSLLTVFLARSEEDPTLALLASRYETAVSTLYG